MKFNSQIIKLLIFLLLTAGILIAQSDSQNFPTPITTNEVTGTIPARDIGDSRLTTYYYGFDGTQGDIFVNLVTKNFNGDIDVFVVGGQQSLSKVVVYADLAESETGRVIYLRKPEKLLLRVQGRSPNDDPSSFRVKFAGSFVASKDNGTQPELPKIAAETTGGIRVNSVGTIIDVPKSVPSPKMEVVETQKADQTETVAVAKAESTPEIPEISVPKIAENTQVKVPLEVVVTDPLPKTEEVPAAELTPEIRENPTPKIVVDTPLNEPLAAVTNPLPKTEEDPAAETLAEIKVPPAKAGTKKRREPKEKAPDPLASIRLVILFKDGRMIERPMNEVFRFSVDKGVLTVTSKNGSIGRYPLLDVTKVTIE